MEGHGLDMSGSEQGHMTGSWTWSQTFRLHKMQCLSISRETISFPSRIMFHGVWYLVT